MASEYTLPWCKWRSHQIDGLSVALLPEWSLPPALSLIMDPCGRVNGPCLASFGMLRR